MGLRMIKPWISLRLHLQEFYFSKIVNLIIIKDKFVFNYYIYQKFMLWLNEISWAICSIQRIGGFLCC
jgi:hypothetical protein